jgi:AAA15 family ATPase/GTPase
LKITGLKRVNLIAGKNNTGKTALLEGICQVHGFAFPEKDWF